MMALATSLALLLSSASAAQRHSVVHVMIDDLRPELGAYGLPNRHTPVIDSIAAFSASWSI